ncbi:MAG: cell division protein FtsA [Chloroflexota bacterium]
MAKDAVVAGIDIGSSKVCALVGELQREGRIRVLGVGVVPSKGIRRGVVVNIEQATEAISAAIAKAERVCGYKVVSAYTTVAGAHISSLNNRGVVAVAGADRIITSGDVRRAVESARVISLPADRQIIHVVPRSFAVDGQDGVNNPVGMVGYRLEVDAHVITAGTTALQNMARCLSRAGVELAGLVFEPLASAEALLSDEEREMGVALADIGGGTSNIAVFGEGRLCHTSVAPLGGGHVTNDLAVGLRTPLANAEELKLSSGHAIAAAVDEQEMVRVSSFGEVGAEVSRRRLCEITEARLEEVCTVVAAEIARAGFDGMLPAGLVLAGGTAETPGLEDLAREICRLPVRVGRPLSVAGLAEVARGPAYAAGVGLLIWAARVEQGELPVATLAMGGQSQTGEGAVSRLGKAPGRVGAWLRSFLP